MEAKFLNLNNLSWERRSFALSNDRGKVRATVLFLSAIMHRKFIHVNFLDFFFCWCDPLRFFWDFSKRIKHQHLTFSVNVRLSLARILRPVQWWSVSMVTRYDVVSRRWSSHFEWKCIFLKLFSKMKVNLVAKIMQSVSYVLLFTSSNYHFSLF